MANLNVIFDSDERTYLDPEMVPNEFLLALIFESIYNQASYKRDFEAGAMTKSDYEGSCYYAQDDYCQAEVELKHRGFMTVPDGDKYNAEQWDFIKGLLGLPVVSGDEQLEIDRKFWQLWLLKDYKVQILDSMCSENGLGVGDDKMAEAYREFEELRGQLEELGWERLPNWE